MNRAFDTTVDVPSLFGEIAKTGLFISFAGTVSSLVGVGAVWTIVALRKDLSIKTELALTHVAMGELIRWMGLAGILWGVVYLIGVMLGRDPVSAPVVVAYQTAQVLPWLWLTMIVLVPLFEECFFRGFLLGGLMGSRLGQAGAVLTTSLLWAAIHTQYGAFEWANLFLLGIVLGWARIKTGSLAPCLLMHGSFNAVSLMVCAYHLS